MFSLASNLLKCSLNTEEEIRLLLIDLDLQRQSHETSRQRNHHKIFGGPAVSDARPPDSAENTASPRGY